MSNFSFWDIMSDSWDTFEDRELFEKLWESYSTCHYAVMLELYQTDIAKSVNHIRVNTRHVWLSFTFNSTTLTSGLTYTLEDDEIVDIPVLRNGIDQYTLEYAAGTDYTVSTGSIEWLSSAPEAETLWAPSVEKDENRISNNWGSLVQEELGDSTAYLNALQGMIYAYWNGPTMRGVRNGLGLFYGLPSATKAGTVFSLDSTSVTIKSGYEDYLTYDIPTDQTCRLSVGDTVSQFDTLTNTVEVFDYISHPRWWKTYFLDIINEDYIGVTLSDDAKDAINDLTKYFTFGVKIDGEQYANLDILSPGISTRFLDKIKPKYTNYFFIISNNFRSTDPSDDNGDWIFFDDDAAGTPNGFLEEWELTLHATFSFNYTNYLATVTGFAGLEPLTFDEYQTQDHEAYDLDTDIIGLWETLEIV